MKDYPISISKQCQNKLTLQMNNSFYQIKITDKKYEIGFFSNISYKNTSILHSFNFSILFVRVQKKFPH